MFRLMRPKLPTRWSAFEVALVVHRAVEEVERLETHLEPHLVGVIGVVFAKFTSTCQKDGRRNSS